MSILKEETHQTKPILPIMNTRGTLRNRWGPEAFYVRYRVALIHNGLR